MSAVLAVVLAVAGVIGFAFGALVVATAPCRCSGCHLPARTPERVR